VHFVDKQNAKKMFSRRQVLSKIHVLSRVDHTIGFKTLGFSGFVLGDSKLELAFLLVSCLLDNVFMNNNKNKNLIKFSIIIIIIPRCSPYFPRRSMAKLH
jgi:hypothetical protein